MISIIILNWNGWKDTISCLRSLYDSVNVIFSVVVVDNGSTNNSVSEITNYAKELNINFVSIKEGDILNKEIKDKDLIIYELSNNYGFAKGNNLGIQLLSNQAIDYYWILNNDTEIEENSIRILESFMLENKEYVACTPQIRFFSPNNKIWNCGGKLFFGFRKYYYAGRSDVVFKKDFFNISFITGCALFIRPTILNNNKELFTDKFFFGEEDFDFSLRMKENNMKMACCTKSIVYHKVSSSSKVNPKYAMLYIHYLNRYINIKHHFSKIGFISWRIINNIYISYLLFRKRNNLYKISRFIKKLNQECILYDGINKNMFETITNKSNTFFI